MNNKSTPALPVAPALLKRLIEYARKRLECGEGTDALKGLSADDAAFIQTYQLGYIPADFRNALSGEDRRTLKGCRIGGTVVVPAFDASGAVVDLLAIYPHGDLSRVVCLVEPVAGLLAPRVATSFDDVLITDSFRLAGKLFKSGKKNTLFVRGVGDAVLNAPRLWECGVRSATLIARREAEQVAAGLQAAGIIVKREKWLKDFDGVGELLEGSPEEPKAITAPELPAVAPLLAADSDKPVLVSHDRKSERATFKSGDLLYSVDVSTESDTRLEVRLECAGKVHLDRFDLAVEPQRKRFATSAAMKTQAAFEKIEVDLVCILDEVRKLQGQLLSPASMRKPAVTLSEAEKAEALQYLKRPDLLDAIADDLEALGWVGEGNAKRLLYLASVSRKLQTPISAALLALSGAGKSKSLETIAELTAPEDLLHVSRLTESSLYYYDGDSLCHKLIVIDEADALTPEVMVSLRVLQTRGALSQSHVIRNPDGSAATHFIEARGPVAVLTSTAGKLDDQVLSRCFEVPIDESAEQTERVLNAMRRLRSDPEYGGSEGLRAKIIRRHHNLQRLIECKPVVITFADRIKFPASSVRHRREMERFLNLIEASALLHQHQRLRKKNSSGEEFIVADVRDYEVAATLSADSIGRAGDELSVNGREVLAAITIAKLSTFSMDDLKASRPDWTRYRFRAGLDELLRLEVLTSPVRGRGKSRQYQLQTSAVSTQAATGVRLLSAQEVGDLAKVGEKSFANFTPRAATG